MALCRLDLRGHRGHELSGGVGEANALDRRLEHARPRATSGLWKAPETLSLTARLAPSARRPHGTARRRRVLAGDHDLARAVVVRRPDADDLGAERLDDVVVETEDRGHRPGVSARPRPSPGRVRDEPDRLARCPSVGRRERGELADRVADDEVRRDPRALSAASTARLVATSAGCCTSVSTRSSTATRSRAAAGRGPDASLPRSIDLHRLRHGLGDVAAHPVLERALAGKQNAISSCRPPVLCPLHQGRSPGRPGPHSRHQHELARSGAGRRPQRRPREAGWSLTMCSHSGRH